MMLREHYIVGGAFLAFDGQETLIKHMSVRGIWDENVIVGIFGTTVGSHHMTLFQFPRLDLLVHP